MNVKLAKHCMIIEIAEKLYNILIRTAFWLKSDENCLKSIAEF